MTEKLQDLLIIDDNEAIHHDFAKIFASSDMGDELSELDAELFGEEVEATETHSFSLNFAFQGKEGLAVLEQAVEDGRTFGAAFVDMRMPPGWDGVETIEHLWKVDPDLQVVICTAYSDRTWDEIFDRLGRTDKLLILKKPFDEIEVVQLAISLSEKRRLLELSRQEKQSLQDVVGKQESELESVTANAEQLIDSIDSVLITVNEQGIIDRWNRRAEETFQINEAKAIGQSIRDLKVEWEDIAKLDALLAHSGDNDQAPNELSFVAPNGPKRTLEFRVFPIVADHSSHSLLLIAVDITQQRNLAAQLDQAQRLESVGQLAAGVAHEINTPMQYIGDNVRYVAKTVDRLAELLECLPALIDEKVSDEEVLDIRKKLAGTQKARKVKSALNQIPEALTDCLDGVNAVAKIVAAMKEFCHPGGDEKNAVCLNHILESSVTVARNEWKYVADVDTDLCDELPSIRGLASELNQAFLNIIVNASHAIGDRVAAGDFDKGFIKIATSEADDHVVVTIQDNGGGIPQSAQDHVFEPFFTTKDVGKGTGQGLAIAHSVVVQKHGGKLWFDVEEGVGTQFTIHLPKDTECDAESVSSETESSEIQFSS